MRTKRWEAARTALAAALAVAIVGAAAPAAAQPGPPSGVQPPGLGGGTAGPPPPATATVSVDCDAGESVNAALATPAGKLTVEISGICHEDVIVQRDDVLLIGTDPATDGLRGVNPNFAQGDNAVLLIQDARRVRVEKLSVSDGVRNNIHVALNSQSVEIVDCLIESSGRDGIQAIDNAFVVVTGTTIRHHARSGLGGFDAEFVLCNDCTIEDANFAILLIGGTRAQTSGGQLSGNSFGVLAFNGGSSIWLDGTSIAGAPWAIGASDYAMVRVIGGTLDGAVISELHSTVDLQGTNQANNPIGYNYLDLSSALRVAAGSSMQGYTELYDLSNLVVKGGSSFDGELFCTGGSDAFCEDSSAVTGPSNCGGCPKP